MKLNTATEFLKRLISETNHPKTETAYNKLLHLVREIKEKNLSEQEISLLETYLDKLRLELTPEAGKKAPKKQFRKFQHFLISDLSLIPKNYYLQLGVGMGLAFGTGLGMSFGIPFGMPMGMIYGMMAGTAIGLAGGILVGKYLDDKAERENRVFDIE